MSYQDIIKRADAQRRKGDAVVWEGICTRCGLIRKAFADEIGEKIGDPYSDIRDKGFKCKSPVCNGRIKWYGRMPAERAIHLNDIRRRK